MSSFKDKLKKLFTDTYNCNYLNNNYNPNPKNIPKINKLYSYSKVIRSINLLNKNNKNTPTKILDDFQPNKINKVKDISNYLNKYSSIPNSHNQHTFKRSLSTFDFKNSNSKIKYKMSSIKNEIEYSNYFNYNFSFKDNNYTNDNKTISITNRPIRNLSCKLFDVGSDSTINYTPINYKTYNTIDFKNASNILINKKNQKFNL